MTRLTRGKAVLTCVMIQMEEECLGRGPDEARTNFLGNMIIVPFVSQATCF